MSHHDALHVSFLLRDHLLTSVKNEVQALESGIAQRSHCCSYAGQYESHRVRQCLAEMKVLNYKLAEGLKVSDYCGACEQRTKHCHVLGSVCRQGLAAVRPEASVS
jgi:hypothetical protein